MEYLRPDATNRRRSLAIAAGFALGAALLCSTSASATAPAPVIATFSVVGFDPATGELGVAVQSKFFAVGSVVPYAEAGVGAIASQAFGNTTFGPRGLAMLRDGKSVQTTLDALFADDPQREQRQVGIVDAKGNAVTYTGKACMPWAGGRVGKNFAVQGNILVSEATVAAMEKAFRETHGMLGERLLTAIEAGQAAGGDARGMQSAAILIMKKGAGYGGYNDRYCDLRVDDHPQPIRELRRIFDMWKVQALIQEGYRRVEAGDFERAIAAGREALALDATSGESQYNLACFLSRAGKAAEALAMLRNAIARDAKLAPRAKVDPDFEPLRKDEEFRKLVGE